MSGSKITASVDVEVNFDGFATVEDCVGSLPAAALARLEVAVLREIYRRAGSSGTVGAPDPQIDHEPTEAQARELTRDDLNALITHVAPAGGYSRAAARGAVVSAAAAGDRAAHARALQESDRVVAYEQGKRLVARALGLVMRRARTSGTRSPQDIANYLRYAGMTGPEIDEVAVAVWSARHEIDW